MPTSAKQVDSLLSGVVTSVSGTADRITSTGGTTPQIDISATFEALLGKVANPLSQFAATTSAQLRGVISDELGTGALLFDGATPTSFTLTNATGLPISTGVSGLGTGVAATLATNLSITGGGTISLGGFTLTVPATGTAILGTGSANRVGLWSGANTQTSSANWTWTSTTGHIYNSNTNAIVDVAVAQGGNAGAASMARMRAFTGTTAITMNAYGTGYTTAGLLVANLGSHENDSTVGTLFANTAASTYFKWSIGGTGTANQVLELTSTALTHAEALNMVFGTTTGTKIGTATSQKIGFWNATPIVQPTTGVAGATLVSNGGTALTSTDTFDGYTLQQVVKALRNEGLLA